MYASQGDTRDSPQGIFVARNDLFDLSRGLKLRFFRKNQQVVLAFLLQSEKSWWT